MTRHGISVEEASRRPDGSIIEPGDPDSLRVLVALGFLEVVEEAENEGDVIYRMLDTEGVKRALDELQAAPPREAVCSAREREGC